MTPLGWARDFAVVGLGLAMIALVFSCVAGCISPQTEEETAVCRQDLVCWSDKHWTTAADDCEPLVVGSAPGRYRWDIGIRVPMFDQVAWHDEEAGVILYEGDRIKFRSATGEWRQMRYRCVHDPESRKTTLLGVEPSSPAEPNPDPGEPTPDSAGRTSSGGPAPPFGGPSPEPEELGTGPEGCIDGG